jgi:hypothetical protein
MKRKRKSNNMFKNKNQQIFFLFLFRFLCGPVFSLIFDLVKVKSIIFVDIIFYFFESVFYILIIWFFLSIEIKKVTSFILAYIFIVGLSAISTFLYFYIFYFREEFFLIDVLSFYIMSLIFSVIIAVPIFIFNKFVLKKKYLIK